MRKIKIRSWIKNYRAGSFIIAFGVLGSILLFRSFAATPYVNIEPENGNKINVTSITNNTSASNNGYVKFGTVSAAKTKKLILFEQSPIPVDSAASQVTILDSLPFDGEVMSIPASGAIMSQNLVGLTNLRSQLAPLQNAHFTKMKNNFLIVYASPAGDYTSFSPNVVQNFSDLAQAASEVGITGVLFDNEEYLGTTWNQSVACPGLTLSQCQINARDAGKQISSAMLQRWPAMKLMSTYGPWISEPQAGSPLSSCCGYFDVSFANQEVGWFLEGLPEGAPMHYIDGGEIYTQNSEAALRQAYTWLQTTFPQVSTIVSASFKNAYDAAVDQSFGIYDFPVAYRGKTSSPTVWKQDITDALKVVDEFTWAYSERFDWSNNPNTANKPVVPSDWLQATIDGRTAAGL
jgi:hypothetical protein